MSKKERKALREKELNDLDSLLEELGALPSKTEDVIGTENKEQAAETVEQNATEEGAADVNAKKKKKKKKVIKEGVEESVTAVVVPVDAAEEGLPGTTAEMSATAPADITSIIKNKLKVKKNTKTKTEAQKVAESLKVASTSGDAKKKEKEKKKKDKKHYNEMTHYN